MEKFRAVLKELGNPLTLLGLDERSKPSKKEIKTAYKEMALKWHPDKSTATAAAAQERFIKIQQAYKLLSDPASLQLLADYQQTFVDQKKRVDEMGATQRKFFDDLKKREADHEANEEQRKKDDIRDMLKRKERQREAAQEEAMEDEKKAKQKEERRKQELLEELANGQLHSQLNSILVKWSGKLKVSYNDRILTSQFRQFGPIKQVTLMQDRRAVIEFLTATAAEKAVQENKTINAKSDDDNDSEDDHQIIKNPLKVRFLLKQTKRESILKEIEVKKVSSKKDSEKDFSLNSSNLSKIADILARAAAKKQPSDVLKQHQKSDESAAAASRKQGITSQVTDIKRSKDRQKFIDEFLKEEAEGEK